MSVRKLLIALTFLFLSFKVLAATDIIMETNYGPIEIELYEKKSPISVKNFLSYMKANHYDDTIFHRVIDNFMIQGGGYDLNLKERPTQSSIINEASNGLKNLYGTIAMARTSVINSATSQFFINVRDNTFLDHRDRTEAGFGYAVFGMVKKSSFPILEKMKVVPTKKNGPFLNLPVNNVIIKSIKEKLTKK